MSIKIKSETGMAFEIYATYVEVSRSECRDGLSYFVNGLRRGGKAHCILSYHDTVEKALEEKERIDKLLSDEEKIILNNEIQKFKAADEHLFKQIEKSGIDTNILITGHSPMHPNRFNDTTKHMVLIDVLSSDCPAGMEGERKLIFLSDEGYQQAQKSVDKGEAKVLLYADVKNGQLHYVTPPKTDGASQDIIYPLKSRGMKI